MTDCCPSQVSKVLCSACANTAISTGRETLIHNIVFPLNMHIEEEQYYYCRNIECDVGYFTLTGNTIRKEDLRVNKQIRRSWLCYCFGISAASYKAKLVEGKAKPVKTFVVLQTKENTCACAIRNPSGQCCLADFKRLEKQHESN